jgi:F-type H+-transporting ATPase subunit b
MLIDPVTVIAQIVNFLILMALLKHFLYDRVLNAMDAREERIRSRLESAKEREQTAEKTLADYREQQRELEETRETELEKARQAAEERRNELIDQAREEVDRKRDQWRRALREDRAALLRDLRNTAGERVFAVCRKVLADLADADLQDQTVRRFLERLETKALDAAEGEVHVRAGFDLRADHRDRLAEALGVSADDLEVTTDADLILGVEARIGDRKVAWSAEDYLSELAAAVRERLEKATGSAEDAGEDASQEAAEKGQGARKASGDDGSPARADESGATDDGREEDDSGSGNPAERPASEEPGRRETGASAP